MRHILPLFGHIVDLIFPPSCVACGMPTEDDTGPGRHFCRKCLCTFKFIEWDYCFKCGKGFGPYSGIQRKCRHCIDRSLFFDRCVAAAHYEGALREAVHSLKYCNNKAAAVPLGMFIADRLRDEGLGSDFDVAIPVPAHPTKMRQRGYNQAELLARVVARELSIPVERNTVVRSKKTLPQYNLSKKARFANLRDSFSVKDRGAVAGKSILLIDDVYTTGATSAAISRALMRSGAARIIVGVAGR